MSTLNTKSAEIMTITQAKEALALATKLYFVKDDSGNYRVSRRRARPICLFGPAGIGKTEIVSQVAKEQDLALCSYSLVHHTRQSLLGLPRLETQIIEGEEVSCTRYTLSEIIDEIHATMAATGKKKGILFLDEFNCGGDALRPIMLQLLQDKSLGTHAIPENWMIVVAANPNKYNKSAKELDAVTMDRLRLMYLDANLEAWLPYARQSGIHGAIIRFLEEHPSYFYRYTAGDSQNKGELVTPRGWEDFSIQLKLMEEIDAPLDPSFLAQFFQCPSLVQSFYMYYRRYAVLAGSGLLDRVFKRDLEAIAQIEALSTHDRWTLVSAVTNRILNLSERCLEKGTAIDQLQETLKSARNVLERGGAETIDQLYALAPFSNGTFLEETLLDMADHVGETNGWKDITDYFQNKLVTPHKKAIADAHEEIENCLFICNRALRDAENVERLLHSISDNSPTLEFIVQGKVPSFQELCINTHLSGNANNIQNLDELKKRLEVV